MTQTRTLRAVTAATLALVVAGLAAPAAAGGGKGNGPKEGRGDRRESRSEQRDAQRRDSQQPVSEQRDPQGNNGTFKVDGLAYDDGLGNEPHVTCEFRLKLYGFDEGQTGDITIAGHAPSGSGTVASRQDVLFSDDAAGGGPNDPDAVFTFTSGDLDLSGLTAHPQQGYHLKVTLSTGEPGGVKHKVFWLEPCVTQPAVGGADDTSGGGDDAGTPGVTPTTPEVGAGDTTTEERARVLGTRFDRADEAAAAEVLGAAAGRDSLAFTGAFLTSLLALGGALLATGVALIAYGARPKRRSAT